MQKVNASQLLLRAVRISFTAFQCTIPLLRTRIRTSTTPGEPLISISLRCRVMSSSSSSSSSSLPPFHRGRPPSTSSQPNRSPPPPPAHSSSSLPLTPSSLSPSSSSPPLLQPPTTFFCYLLRSLSPRHPSHTYIGFTTSPLRRLRQHNGDLTAGAWRTSKKRPWEVVAVVHGFTSKVVALQFEWHWTYPTKSKRMRTVMGLRRWCGGVRGKVEVMYQLLTTAPWSTMPLHVRFTTDDAWKVHETIIKRSDKERKEWEKKQSGADTEEERVASYQRKHIYALPPHVSVTVGPLEELDHYRWLRQRRGPQKRREEANALTDPALSVTPGGDDEDLSLYEDEATVSGEESLNSGASDAEGADAKEDADPSDDDVILQSPDASSRTAKRPRSSPSLASREMEGRADGSWELSRVARLRCQLCFGLVELGDPRSRSFFSGCDQCAFVGHLACMAQLIFKQMEGQRGRNASVNSDTFPSTQPAAPRQPLSSSSSASSSSTLSPVQRSTSSSSSLSPGASFTPSSVLFSSVPSTLPLLPPPSTGSCPACHSVWSYPLLVDRCRFMHTDSQGRRGGDVWYRDAEQFSMATLVRHWAGRGGEDKQKRKEEEKRERLELKQQRAREKKEATERKAKERADSPAVVAAERTKRRSRGVKSKAAQWSEDSGSDASSGAPHSDDSEMRARKRGKGENRFNKETEHTDEAPSPVRRKKTGKAPAPVSRRVEMIDRSPALPSSISISAAPSTSLFASSQPALRSLSSASPPSLSASQPPPRVPPNSVVTLSDYEDDEDHGDLADAIRRRRLMAEAAERRLGRCTESPPRVTVEMKAEGSAASREGKQGAEDGRKWVHLDDDDEESS